ncbi:SRPBCC family protein [bacterium]|nr:SRPBCC family protein [bacterium]MBU1985388.1 SRPBCC family protein [bacterium]
MSRQMIITEIGVPRERAWELLTDPKEFSFWAPNVRDLELDPPKTFAVDTVRRFRLDVTGKIETLETQITHCTPPEMFAEIPIGGSMKIHEKVEQLKMIYRLETVDAKTCSLTFTMDYKMKGLMNQLLEQIIMGGFTSQLKLWFERLKTYAETGRPV